MRIVHADFLQDNGRMYEALRTISGFFLRADSKSICDCIDAFGLNDLLLSVAKAEMDKDSDSQGQAKHGNGRNPC